MRPSGRRTLARERGSSHSPKPGVNGNGHAGVYGNGHAGAYGKDPKASAYGNGRGGWANPFFNSVWSASGGTGRSRGIKIDRKINPRFDI